MCPNNLSSSNLIGLSSSLAILIGEELSIDELSVLAAFFTSFADNLEIIATKRTMEENIKNQKDRKSVV